MDRRFWTILPLAVLANTLAGLAWPMMEVGAGIFVDVWAASVLGDLLFVAGTAGVLWLGRTLLHHPARTVQMSAWAAVFLANWLCYALAWTVTSGALREGGTMVMDFGFVLEWGWPGLVGAAGVAALAPFVERPQQDASPA